MIFWFDRLDSTNNVAKRLSSHIDNMSVIAASCQFGGRGQGDHTWQSEPGANLTFSSVLKFGEEEVLAARDACTLTHIATWAVLRFLSDVGIEAKIKLPNDIYVDGRKICGILIENTLLGANVKESIIGIGLNLNQRSFPSDLPNPVSACQLTGKELDLDNSLRTLSGYITSAYIKANSLQGRKVLEEEFGKALLPICSEAGR